MFVVPTCHLFNIPGQFAHAIEPGYTNDLEKCEICDTERSCVVVHQLEYIDAALDDVRQTKK